MKLNLSVLIALLLIPVFVLLFELSLYNYLLYHTIIEFFAVFVGLSLTLLSLATVRVSSNKLFVKIGVLYFFVSLVDFVHTLGYKGMNIFHTWTANQPTQLWILGRFLEVFGMFTIFFLPGLRNDGFIIFLSIITTLGSVGLFTIFYGVFPDCFVEGFGLTTFKVVMEYVIIAMAFTLMLRVLYLKRKVSRQKPCFCNQIFFSMLLTALGEFSFTLYTDVYGFFNFLGHVFRFYSYYVLLQGLIVQSLIDPMNTLLQEIKLQKEELERIAYYDALTKLYSRSFFEEILKKHLEILERKKSSSTLILIDVDDFKMINDTYGHSVGDKVLEFVGKCLSSVVRSSDITARFGGDEFIIVLNESNAYQAVNVVQRIKDAIHSQNPFKFSIGISYGVAEFSGKSDYEAALKSADSALYEMKKKKKMGK